MMLSAREVSKSYGKRLVLDQVTLCCEAGEICGLIGPNGAGKSTLFRILMGLVSPDAGRVAFPSDTPKPLGGIIEKPALYGYLSAQENLMVFARVQGLFPGTPALRHLLEQVGLSASRTDPVRNYSMGMKQRLGLAIALLNDPKYLILDEPFSGLDPIGIRSLQEQVRTLAGQRGIGILISSHNLAELGDLCDRLYVINQGRITREGPAREILQAAATEYLLYGKGFETSRVLQGFQPEFRNGSVLITPGDTPIADILTALTGEGMQVMACIPHTNLGVLFEKEAP